MRKIVPYKQFYIRVGKPAKGYTNISLNFPNGLVFLDYDEFTRLAKNRKLIFIGYDPDLYPIKIRCYKFKRNLYNK
jgi:hypothetical protein